MAVDFEKRSRRCRIGHQIDRADAGDFADVLDPMGVDVGDVIKLVGQPTSVIKQRILGRLENRLKHGMRAVGHQVAADAVVRGEMDVDELAKAVGQLPVVTLLVAGRVIDIDHCPLVERHRLTHGFDRVAATEAAGGVD